MPKRILCVEDDPNFRWAITETLNYAGYEVIEAENGLTGLVVASTSAPDLILMDVQLPGVSGLDAVAQIREKPELADIPIIMMTAGVLDAFSEACISMQCNGCMFKPFEMDYLERIIGGFLDRPYE